MTATLRCFLRKKQVVATPEEKVRQTVLQWMVEELGYPKSLIALEKGLKKLPHLTEDSLPLRRADILFYGKEIEPLLLVECKANRLIKKDEIQVIAYNRYVKAPFVALASSKEVRMGWYDENKERYTFLPYIPSYSDLMASLNFS